MMKQQPWNCLTCGLELDREWGEDMSSKLPPGVIPLYICDSCGTMHLYQEGVFRKATAGELFRLRMKHPAQMDLLDRAVAEIRRQA